MRYVLPFALLFASTAAFADPVDFSTKLLGQDGKPVPECIRVSDDKTKCTDEIELTLGWLSRFALDMPEERGGSLPLSDILKRGSLSEKIKANPTFDLSVDEAKLIKDQIVKLPYKTNIKFQALRLIDPQGTKDAK